MLDNILLVLVSFVMAILLGWRIIPGILVVAHHKNLFDLPDERKVHDRPIPRLGGVTFFPVIVFVMSVIGLLGCLSYIIGNPQVVIPRLQILSTRDGECAIFG